MLSWTIKTVLVCIFDVKLVIVRVRVGKCSLAQWEGSGNAEQIWGDGAVSQHGCGWLQAAWEADRAEETPVGLAWWKAMLEPQVLWSADGLRHPWLRTSCSSLLLVWCVSALWDQFHFLACISYSSNLNCLLNNLSFSLFGNSWEWI